MLQILLNHQENNILDKLTNKEKELIISKALETDEARKSLAKAMADQIRSSLNSISFVRRFFY